MRCYTAWINWGLVPERRQMSWSGCLTCMKSQTAEWQTNRRNIFRSCHFLRWFWSAKSCTLKWQNSLSENTDYFSLKLLWSWRFVKGNYTKSVTTDQNESHFLSVSVCYLCRHTYTHTSHINTHTIVEVRPYWTWHRFLFLREVISDEGEERSSSPDIKLSYPFVPSQIMPTTEIIHMAQFKYASLKFWWRSCQLIYSTSIILVNENELFMSTSDATKIQTSTCNQNHFHVL